MKGDYINPIPEISSCLLLALCLNCDFCPFRLREPFPQPKSVSLFFKMFLILKLTSSLVSNFFPHLHETMDRTGNLAETVVENLGRDLKAM